MQLSSVHQALGLIPDATKQILSNNQTEGIRTTLRWGLNQRTAGQTDFAVLRTEPRISYTLGKYSQ